MNRPLSAGDVVRTAAQRWSERPAAILGDESITFGQMADQASRVARALQRRGVGRGDRVAWSAPTSLEACPFFFACGHLGAMFTPMNPGSTPDEFARVVRVAEPAVLAGTGSGSGDHTVEVSFDELLAEGQGGLDYPEVHEDDPLVIFFTSGTTGEPKGCVISHRTQRLRAGVGRQEATGGSVCMFPQFHMAGWALTLETWLSGQPMIYVTRPDADDLVDAIEGHRAERIYLIPAVWNRVLSADLSRRDLTSLRRADTGTSATTPELLAGIAAAVPGAVTNIAYGSTEANEVCRLGHEDLLRKPGSVGRPAPGVYVRTDEDGELWATSSVLFSGYFRNPDATNAALVDGWYRTGDLAEADSEGYYSIVGRANDMVRTGGETVAPVEVELVVHAHPAVSDVAVVGVPDDAWGQVLCAFVVLQPGGALSIDELRRYCEPRLARHKHPRRLMVVDRIPRTPATGQVQRRVLLRQLEGT